jgi:GNAT superfamily N-acetyltransferase
LRDSLSNDPLRFVPAASVSLEEYAAAVTSVFRGYQFPMVLDVAILARKVRLEQHDLEHSLVAYDGGEMVGAAVLALRADAGWVGGFGIVPEQRGRGRGRELMSALLEQARACGLRRLSLEVLVRNAAARRLYESAGMHVVRDLLILERAASSGVEADARDDSLKVEEMNSFKVEETNSLKEAAPFELLTHFARLHIEPPAWQRNLPTLLIGNLRGLYLGERERPRAYALLGTGQDGTQYVSDLAAAEAEDAAALCASLKGVAGALKIVNEPEHSLFTAPLLANGFVETERQHEMQMSL